MDQEKLIEEMYAFFKDQYPKGSTSLSLQTLKNKFLPDVEGLYKGKVLVVVNTTLYKDSTYVDARASTLLDREDYEWWKNHEDVEFEIDEEGKSFGNVLEKVLEKPLEIHNFLSFGDGNFFRDDYQLRDALNDAKEEYLEDQDSSEEEEDNQEEGRQEEQKTEEFPNNEDQGW